MNKIAETLLKPRTIFTFMFFATLCYLVLSKIDVPPMLNTIVSNLLGFYFGEKVGKNNKDHV